jgi:DHA1 family tetracycline resistance protein-like MFS transporter
MRRNRLALVIAFVFIDLLGYSLFLPLLPFYAGVLGAPPTLVGFLVASNALAQLIAAPVIGRLSDRLGRRPMLIWLNPWAICWPASLRAESLWRVPPW